MATQWYHKNGNEERGPLQFRELIEMARSGAIGKADLVRSSWHKDWQKAESVLQQYFVANAEPKDTQWSDTIKAAVAASKARQAGRNTDQPVDEGESIANPFRGLGGIFGWIVAPFAWLGRLIYDQFEDAFDWLGNLWGGPAAWIRQAIPVAFALAAGCLIWFAIEEWSAQDALLRSSLRMANQKSRTVVTGRKFPLFGECDRGTYRFLMIDAVAVVGIGTYFGIRWLVVHEEKE